jgi:membrane protein YdbS with pleckstrin-like domain
MDEVKICPQCERCTDPDRETCPYCGSVFTKSTPEKNTRQDPVQDKDSDSWQKQDTGNGAILLSTNPERTSFLFKYLMAFSPIVLVIVCVFVRMILERMFQIGSSSFISVVPDMMSGYTTGALNQYASPITYATSLTILMIAPVGIFIFFASVGWSMRLTELWTSTSLTLGLSGVAGMIMTALAGVSPASGNYLLLLLQWIEFLVQPFCFVAAVIVILATEKFRRSIRYTITREGLWIRGGFLSVQEHMVPHGQIGRIVFEQDFLGSMFNYGTLIPQSMTRWGQEMSLRGIGAAGQKDSFGAGIGFAKGREEGSRYPLDCLYGIADPKRAQAILTELICRHDKREDEQVSYLKKIYETNVAKTPPRGSGIRDQGPAIVPGRSTHNDFSTAPSGSVSTEGEMPEYTEPAVIRIHDDAVPVTTMSPAGGNAREIPPLAKTEIHAPQGTYPAESVLDQIKKLGELKNSGIITEQEFTTKKTELLKRL